MKLHEQIPNYVTLFALLLILLIGSQMTGFSQVSLSGALSGNYSNLRLAFNAINSTGGVGAVSVNITADHTITTSAAILNQTNYTVTILASGNRTVTGNFNSDAVTLNGADNVIIEGGTSGSGNSLTIVNPNTGASAAVLSLINSANNNQIRNVTLRGSVTNTFSLGVLNIKGNSDNNKILTCKIGGQSATGTMRNGIVLQGSNTAATNDNNEISGCQISNFYMAGAYGEGIFSYQYNRGTLINNNSFFLDGVSITNSTANTVMRGIEIQDGEYDALATVTITNNYIGGTAPNCSGGPWIVNSPSVFFFMQGIWVSTGTGTGASIQGNVITNISLSGIFNNSGLWLCFDGIYMWKGVGNIGTTIGNTIGSTAINDAISISLQHLSAGTVTVSGIANGSASAVNIANNQIGGYTITRSVSSTSGLLRFNGIYSDGNNNISIANNTIGSQTQPNSNRTGTLAAPVSLIGININNSSSNISGNTIKHMTNSQGWEVTGILSWHDITGRTFTCSNNTISQLKADGGPDNDVTGIFVFVPGVSVTFTTQINGNTISDFTVTAPNGSDLSGILIGSGVGTLHQASGSCSNNNISNLTNFSPDENAFSSGINVYSSYNGAFALSNNTVSNIQTRTLDTYGIRVNDDNTTTGTVTLTGNTISNMEVTRFSGPNYPTGIQIFGKTITLEKNKVFALRAPTGTLGSEIRGVQVLGNNLSNYQISNNFVSLGFDGSGFSGIYGIANNSGAAINDLDLYFNTVFIGGNGFGPSAAFYRNTASNVSTTIRNNIFYNARFGGLAVSNPIGAAGWSSGASDKNYFVSPGASALANWGGATYDMAGWQVASGGDFLSVTRTAGLNPGETNPINFFTDYTNGVLSLQTTNPNEVTIVQDIGETVPGITTDYFGTARAGNPDIGAFEFATVLPVELLDFQAFALENGNRLHWVTALEADLASFEIERSLDDALSFQLIGSVAPRGQAASYQFDDPDFSEKAWYRIRSVDQSGQSTVSSIVFVRRLDTGIQTALFPNPSYGNAAQLVLSTEKEEEIQIRIFDVHGRAVHSFSFDSTDGERQIPIDLTNLPGGNYVVQVMSQGWVRELRLVRM